MLAFRRRDTACYEIAVPPGGNLLPLSDYLRIIQRRGWIIVLTAFLGAVSALLFSLVQTPVYQSTIRLNVIGARPDFGLSQSIVSLLRNYAGQIKSYDTATLALRDMPEPLDLTPDGLLAMVNVQAIQSDLQLVIEVEDEDPHIAQMVAQQMADTFAWTIEQFNLQLEQSNRVMVFASGPATPASKISPHKKINTAAGGILGAILGLGIVILLEWMDSRFVRSPADLQRDLDLPVLALVGPGGDSGAGAAVSKLAGNWTIPLLGGVALGVLLTSVVYLVL